MPYERTIGGNLSQVEDPDWSPLEGAIGDELVAWFMWMHEVQLADGRRLHAYKHVTTRRYLYLTHGGCAFAPRAGDSYCEIGLSAALARVCGRPLRARHR